MQPKYADELKDALKDLFDNCAMIHSVWGEDSNAQAADKAIARARELLERSTPAQEQGIYVFNSNGVVTAWTADGQQVKVCRGVDYDQLEEGYCPVCGNAFEYPDWLDSDAADEYYPCGWCGYFSPQEGDDNALECAVKLYERILAEDGRK